MEALGFVIETTTMSFWERRLHRLAAAVYAICQALLSPAARLVLKVAGHVVSCRLALGMTAIFHICHLFLAVWGVGPDVESPVILPARSGI